MKLEHFLTLHTKINWKWIKNLYVRSETIKLLEENIGRTLDVNQSKILYDPPPRVTEIKTKINKWDLMKLKCFCTEKETISKVKRKPSEWEKVIANETTDKGLISRIFKQLIQLNTRIFLCVYKEVYRYLVFSCMSCSYILEINLLSVDSFAIIFSHSEDCLFILFIVSFAVQKFF